MARWQVDLELLGASDDEAEPSPGGTPARRALVHPSAMFAGELHPGLYC